MAQGFRVVCGKCDHTIVACEAQRRAREWDAAHPREPYCTPCQPAEIRLQK